MCNYIISPSTIAICYILASNLELSEISFITFLNKNSYELRRFALHTCSEVKCTCTRFFLPTDDMLKISNWLHIPHSWWLDTIMTNPILDRSLGYSHFTIQIIVKSSLLQFTSHYFNKWQFFLKLRLGADIARSKWDNSLNHT